MCTVFSWRSQFSVLWRPTRRFTSMPATGVGWAGMRKHKHLPPECVASLGLGSMQCEVCRQTSQITIPSGTRARIRHSTRRAQPIIAIGPRKIPFAAYLLGLAAQSCWQLTTQESRSSCTFRRSHIISASSAQGLILISSSTLPAAGTRQHVQQVSAALGATFGRQG